MNRTETGGLGRINKFARRRVRRVGWSMMAESKFLARAFAGRRVLITGGMGFIGSNLARALVGLGAKVTVVDAMIPEYGGNRRNVVGLAGKIRVHRTDVREHAKLARLVRGQDFLFNLAGQTSHMDSMTDPETDLEINCRAQLALLEACRKNNPAVRIVFASTRQIYGKPDYLPVDERHPVRPVDVNGINKAAGEAFHLLYARVHGLRATACRKPPAARLAAREWRNRMREWPAKGR